MSAGLIALVAIAGGVGAGLRYLVDRWLGGRDGVNVGVLVVNITGSFALGMLTGLGSALASDLLLVLGAGLLGGYTTFSAVSVEVVLLAELRRWTQAATALFATLGLSVVAAGFGFWLGSGSVVLT